MAQQVPERLRARRLDEADRAFDGADLDDVADADRDVLAAVDRDERLVGVDDAAADDLARARRRPTGSPTGSAAIGVTTRLRLTGSTIGPPAENE